MNLRFPALDNWQDFQRLCKALYSKKYNAEFLEYGSMGERQHGVDIKGRIKGSTKLTAIQCKDYKKSLGEKLIRKEYSEALIYNEKIGKLEQFIISTTNPRTIKYEKLINELSENSPFPIYIVFWEDLSDLINNHRSIIHEFYPQLLVSVNQNGDANGKFFRLSLPEHKTLLEFMVSKIPKYDDGQFSNDIIVTNPRERKCSPYMMFDDWHQLKDAFHADFDAYAVASFINSFNTIDNLLAQQDVADTFYLDPEGLERWGF